MRDREFLVYPSQVRTYLQCPAQYSYRYVERVGRVQPARHEMIRGNALHHLMGRVMRQVKAGRAVSGDIDRLAAKVTAGLDYPAEIAKMRAEDTQDIARWSIWALGQVDDGTRVVDVERRRYHMLSGSVRGRRITLCSQVDAVVERADGVIEHIDYKTGKVRPDPVQELISRTVVGTAYGAERPVITTTLFVAQQRRESRQLKPAEMRPVWEDVKRAITAMEVGDGPWEPRPSALCQWCCDICPASE